MKVMRQKNHIFILSLQNRADDSNHRSARQGNGDDEDSEEGWRRLFCQFRD